MILNRFVVSNSEPIANAWDAGYLTLNVYRPFPGRGTKRTPTIL